MSKGHYQVILHDEKRFRVSTSSAKYVDEDRTIMQERKTNFMFKNPDKTTLADLMRLVKEDDLWK